MKFAPVIIVAALLLAPFSLYADYCQWEQVCDSEARCYYVNVCRCEYNAIQENQPRWNLYQTGDQVYGEVSPTDPSTILRWYVVPAGQPGSSPFMAWRFGTVSAQNTVSYGCVEHFGVPPNC